VGGGNHKPQVGENPETGKNLRTKSALPKKHGVAGEKETALQKLPGGRMNKRYDKWGVYV